MREDIQEEFLSLQNIYGYEQPPNLSNIEGCPIDDELPDIYEESGCRVDLFLKKNKGLRKVANSNRVRNFL